MGRSEEFDRGRSQEEFDKKFQDIVLNHIGHESLKARSEALYDLGPIESQCEVNCNRCGAEIEANSVYDPNTNIMHYRCPECKKPDTSSNWLEFGKIGEDEKGNRIIGYKSPWDDTPVTVDNIRDHVVLPDPKKPRLTVEEVNSKKWAKESMEDDD